MGNRHKIAFFFENDYCASAKILMYLNDNNIQHVRKIIFMLSYTVCSSKIRHYHDTWKFTNTFIQNSIYILFLFETVLTFRSNINKINFLFFFFISNDNYLQQGITCSEGFATQTQIPIWLGKQHTNTNVIVCCLIFPFSFSILMLCNITHNNVSSVC